jgi:hypothetical protein
MNRANMRYLLAVRFNSSQTNVNLRCFITFTFYRQKCKRKKKVCANNCYFAGFREDPRGINKSFDAFCRKLSVNPNQNRSIYYSFL